MKKPAPERRNWRRRAPAEPRRGFLVRFTPVQVQLIEQAVDDRRAQPDSASPTPLPTITGFIIAAAVDHAKAEATHLGTASDTGLQAGW